jgi:alkyl sulfatase BDS1-like metallo-beta-lactamase superfamily hydrolase
MEMISHLYNTDSANRSYKELRALTMIRLAEGTPSVLSRYYLLSQALEMWDLLPGVVKINTRNSLATLHLDGVFQNMQVHANAEKIEAELSSLLSLYLVLTDEQTYKLTFRNSILNYEAVTTVPAGSLTFETTLASFRSYIVTDPFDSASRGTASGGTSADVDNFFGYFDFQDEG